MSDRRDPQLLSLGNKNGEAACVWFITDISVLRLLGMVDERTYYLIRRLDFLTCFSAGFASLYITVLRGEHQKKCFNIAPNWGTEV